MCQLGQLGNGQEMLEKWPGKMLEKWPGKMLEKWPGKMLEKWPGKCLKNGQCKCLKMARKMLENGQESIYGIVMISPMLE